MTNATQALEQNYSTIANEARSLSQLIAVNTAGLSRKELANLTRSENDIAWRQLENLIEDAENINNFGKNGIKQIAQHAELVIEAIQRNEPTSAGVRIAIDHMENHVSSCIGVAQALRNSCTHSVQAIHDVDPNHAVFTRGLMASFISSAFHRAIEERLLNIHALMTHPSAQRA